MSSTSGWNAVAKRLDGMKKPTKTLKMCDDPDIHDRYLQTRTTVERTREYLDGLSGNADADARAIYTRQHVEAQAAFDAAREDYDAHTVTLTFRALEREELEKLQAAHPAGEEDEAMGRDFNFDTFAPALISAASMDGMPLEYAASAMKTWSLADSEDLWNAAWSVQRRKRTDLGKG